MNYSPKQPLTCKTKHLFNKLKKAQVKGDYNLNLSFFRDSDETTPSIVHSTGNSIRISFLKLAAILSVIALLISLILALRSLRNR